MDKLQSTKGNLAKQSDPNHFLEDVWISEALVRKIESSKFSRLKQRAKFKWSAHSGRCKLLDLVEYGLRKNHRSSVDWSMLCMFEGISVCESLVIQPSLHVPRPHQGWMAVPVSSLGPSSQIGELRDSWESQLQHESKSTTPRWLWDIHEKKTVAVAPEKSMPYTAISYTWGRWRRKVLLNNGDNIRPCTRVQGVDWPVPLLEEDAFTHSDLIQAIEKLSCTRYAWIDIFCIPQENSRDADRRGEIAKQAGIFGNAINVVAWLWDLKDIELLRQYMQGISLTLSLLNTWNEGKKAESLELDAVLFDQNLDSSNRDPLFCSWFSSLWTLQETILAPHLRICSFDAMTVVDSQNNNCSPLVLGHSFRLISTLSKARHTMEALEQDKDHSEVYLVDEQKFMAYGFETSYLIQFMPRFLRQLAKLGDSSMADAVNHSRLHILNASRDRIAESRRGEAIMSAIGCTDWFKKTSNTRDASKTKWIWKTEPHLHEVKVGESIPGTSEGEGPGDSRIEDSIIPIALLSELARKMGSSFFLNVPTISINKGLDFTRPLGQQIPYYSVLPYGSQRVTADRHDSPLRWEADCSNWQIASNYFVSIPGDQDILDPDLVARFESIGTLEGLETCSPALDGLFSGHKTTAQLSSVVKDSTESDNVVLVPLIHQHLQTLVGNQHVTTLNGIILIRKPESQHFSGRDLTENQDKKYLNIGTFGYHFVFGEVQQLVTTLGREIQVGDWFAADLLERNDWIPEEIRRQHHVYAS